MISKEESKRLHMDWWGKCRTCRHWAGTDQGDGSGSYMNNPRWNPGICTNSKSELFELETWTDGHCPRWDSFDIDTALELMEEGES